MMWQIETFVARAVWTIAKINKQAKGWSYRRENCVSVAIQKIEDGIVPFFEVAQ